MQTILNLGSVHLCRDSTGMISTRTDSLSSLPGEGEALSVNGVVRDFRTSDYHVQIPEQRFQRDHGYDFNQEYCYFG